MGRLANLGRQQVKVITIETVITLDHGQLETAYMVGRGDDGQSGWIADTDFGPFDDVWDLVQWVSRYVALEVRRHVR